ncbi:MAG: hypothetical protein NC932_04450, partial [Candidatus Omnitrophica bacterium]|nr:hypothetical protein [Candidatus Omnitrophota bacterium]
MKLERYLISGLFLFFLYLHFYGINWGIPDEQVSSMVFKNKNEIGKLIPIMLTTHQEIREMQVYYGAPYKDDYQLKQNITVALNR